MEKVKNISDRFVTATNKIISLTEDERVVQILNVIIEELYELEDEEDDVIYDVDVDIDSALNKLETETKLRSELDVICDVLREIRNLLVKRYELTAAK